MKAMLDGDFLQRLWGERLQAFVMFDAWCCLHGYPTLYILEVEQAYRW